MVQCTYLLDDTRRAQRLAAEAALFRQPVDRGLLHGRFCCKVPRLGHDLRSDRASDTYSFYGTGLLLTVQTETCLPAFLLHEIRCFATFRRGQTSPKRPPISASYNSR